MTCLVRGIWLAGPTVCIPTTPATQKIAEAFAAVLGGADAQAAA
jgi:hypothetical protein